MTFISYTYYPCVLKYFKISIVIISQKLFGIGQSASIEISLNNLSNRKIVETKLDQNQTCLLPVFYNGETISGNVTISLKRGSKLEYQAIKIELIGHIDFFADRGSRDEFLNRSQDLARPGILSQASTTYPFRFDNVEMPYESYFGSNVQLRYVILFCTNVFIALYVNCDSFFAIGKVVCKIRSL